MDDAVSLLVLVRLWRILHIVSGIVNDIKMSAAHKENQLRSEIQRLRNELEEVAPGLVKVQNEVEGTACLSGSL